MKRLTIILVILGLLLILSSGLVGCAAPEDLGPTAYRVEQLEQDNAELQAELDSLHTELAALESEIEALQTSLTQLEALEAEQSTSLEGLRELLAELMEKHKKCKKRIKKLSAGDT